MGIYSAFFCDICGGGHKALYGQCNKNLLISTARNNGFTVKKTPGFNDYNFICAKCAEREKAKEEMMKCKK